MGGIPIFKQTTNELQAEKDALAAKNGASMVDDDDRGRSASKRLEIAETEGRNLWLQFTSFAELTENHRWKEAGGLLSRIAPLARVGAEIPVADLDALNANIALSDAEVEGRNRPKALWIAPTNEKCGEINERETMKLVAAGAEHMTVYAFHTPGKQSKDHGSPSQAKRLELLKVVPGKKDLPHGRGCGLNKQHFCVGSRVRVSRNICTDAGLYQGAKGTVVGFGIPTDFQSGEVAAGRLDMYKNCTTLEKAAILNAMPPYVFVQMDNAMGDDDPKFASFFKDMKGVVCFAPEPQRQSIQGYVRWMHPLLVAFASTYHKAQVTIYVSCAVRV